jgi:excisionase family DNA binding protein
MTDDEVRSLPVSVDLPTAARALGLGRTAPYELVRNGTWQTPVVRPGRLILIPRAHLLELLGLSAVV